MDRAELEKLWRTFSALGRIRLATTFFCDPRIPVRPATDADRRIRHTESHPDRREILVVLEGSFEFLLEDRMYLLRPGDAILADHDEVHQSYYPEGSPDGCHFTYNITPEQIINGLLRISNGNWFSMLPSNCFHYAPQNRALLLDALKMARKGASENAGSELAAFLMFYTLRGLRLCGEKTAYEDNSVARSIRIRIWRVMDYIDVQYGRACSISTLAKLAEMGRTSFVAHFRRYAGCSVLEYVNLQRVRRCRALLRPLARSGEVSRRPLKVCAQELGFSSPQAFARWRKQHLAELAADGFPLPMQRPGFK